MFDDIKRQFIEVIRESQDIDDPQVDTLFADWEENKAKFLKMFGGPIFEWPLPVDFSLDEKEKEVRAMSFANYVSNSVNNEELAHFIDENLSSFYENKVTVSKNSKIPTGMKLVKAFKFFEPNPTTLHHLQDAASQIIQENKISGTLCFSVHPLDFLSSSMNTYNWRSCHALDGEYRSGNLSYMVDKTTFMVYIRGANNVNLPLFPTSVPWNSKKWRMLIHLAENDELMFAGRQYPFSSKSGLDLVLSIFNNFKPDFREPFANTTKMSKWQNDYVDSYISSQSQTEKGLESEYAVIRNRLIDIREIVYEGAGALNYNDVLHSTCYTKPYYSVRGTHAYRGVSSLRGSIIVGGMVHCLHCGTKVINSSETMRCNHCELEFGTEMNEIYGGCACCGRRIFLDDAPEVGYYGELVCESCYDNECFVCQRCGEAHYNENKHYHPMFGNLCRECYNEKGE